MKFPWPLVLALIAAAVAVITAVVLWASRRRGDTRLPANSGRNTGLAATTAAASSAASAAPAGEAAPSREDPSLHAARARALRELAALAFGVPARAAAPTRGLAPPGAAPSEVPSAPPVASAPREAARAPASTGPSDEVTTAIRATLAGIADRPHYAPRRPLLLPRLMQAMNDDEISRRDLSRLIATDPALAGSLLRLANSPFYRIQSEPVESLDRALALLGLEGMRSLISAALLQPVFRISGGMFAQFGDITWEHTLYAASASEAYAAVVENTDPFAAQLLALMMGLAAIVVFRVATDEFLARHIRPSPAVLGALIELEGAPVARRVAGSWELSERIDRALADQGVNASSADSPLGRSLQMGRFIGALELLRVHERLSEEDVQAALATAGSRADACLRIWSRLRATAAAQAPL